ncbi:unnamed protein product [Nezara viridula]|uniref:Uncharacterized protein n=1 Tax=Nezara viridula TaxID=85310 RepID=A0A9P0HC79_NEZVI|nr:unnamed protein product [Nezara viridula]
MLSKGLSTGADTSCGGSIKAESGRPNEASAPCNWCITASWWSAATIRLEENYLNIRRTSTESKIYLM